MAAGSGLGNGYLSGLKVSSQKPDSMHTFVHKEFLNGLKKESLVMLQGVSSAQALERPEF